MAADGRNASINLPLKGNPSTATVSNSPVSCSQSTSQSASAVSSVVPSSVSSCDFISDTKLSQQQPKDKKHHHFNALARVSNILNKSKEPSPPRTPLPVPKSITSPMSSSDSLASLIEKQERNKISNPSHQLFNNSNTSYYTHQKKPSSGSVFSLLNSTSLHRRSSSNSTAPAVKSPLNNQVKPNQTTTRRLTPNHSNPTHLHSSPNVKESRKVYLEYDPVSKRKVLNTYEIVREIGRGEHGKVKLAKEINSGEFVAIKIVDRKGKQKIGKALGSSEEEKIRREIAIMKKINHPNVVQLKEVLDDVNSRKIYLVLEFLEKGEVKWQKSPGVPLLTLPEAMKVFRDVILGLEYLHYQGIIHRDIKPANLLIAKNGSVKISDFGVSFASSLKNGEEQNDYDLAKTAGTPAFFAPEICKPLTNFKFDDNNNTDDFEITYPKITSKIDVWALGITLYCLLFGSMPFWATNEFELFKVICDKQLEFPVQLPENYEWTEEDKFEAKNLLYKMLEKDSGKRISIREIKRHPFVLRNLSVEESRIFSTVQKACENKIEVSNAEVSVAVTGIASKLRKSLAKALKFATGIGSDQSLNSNSSTSLFSPFNKVHSRNPSNDFNGSNSTLINTNLPNFADKLSPVKSTPVTSPSSRARVLSIESATETKAVNVEGDLFLKKGSAFNSLSHIMNDDKRRSSISSGTYTSTVSEDCDGSNDSSSFSKSGSQLVSLPVNASFASLDSVYLDNYATTYYTDVKDARNPKSNRMDPPVIPFPSSLSSEETPKDEIFGDFTLNKSAETNFDDAIGPHEPPAATFDLNNDSDESEEDESSVGDFYGEGIAEPEYDDRIVFDRQTSNDGVSEFSIPSMLVNDLVPSVTVTSNEGMDKDDSEEENESYKVAPLISKRQITKPKYSFFENSDTEEEEDSDLASSVTHISEDNIIDVEGFEFYESEESDSCSDTSEGEELTLSFGRRNRNNTIPTSTVPVLSLDRPSSEPQLPTLMFNSSPKAERYTSPLSKNAPHTPFSTVNAHLVPKTDLYSTEFVNHYHKIQPEVAYHLNNDINSDEEERGRTRSNSITMGILGHQASRN